ncbi:MAG: S26 family signal peptidase, partial [Ruminococcus sp.]|nr:S26 family signal peptidase [Ruminococcus sp.]
GKVFVLGDNRTISLDSRFSLIGLIDVKDILGVILTD